MAKNARALSLLALLLAMVGGPAQAMPRPATPALVELPARAALAAGRDDLTNGRLSMAIAAFDRARRNPHGLSTEERELVQISLGLALIRSGQPARALTVLRQGDTSPESVNGQIGRLHVLASGHSALGRHGAALDTYAIALRLVRTSKNADLAAELALYGGAAMASGQPKVAVVSFEELLAMRRKSNNVRNLSTALHLVGWARATIGEHREAAGLIDQAAALRRRSRDTPALVDSLTLLANVRFALGEYALARTAVMEAINLAEPAPATFDLAGLRLLAGAAALMAKDGTAAITSTQAGLNLTAANSAQRGAALHQLGWVLGDLGRHDEAITVLRQAIEVRSALNSNPEQIADSQLLLAGSLQVAERHELAIAQYEVLLTSARRGVLPPGLDMADVLVRLGGALVAGGRAGEGVPFLTEAVSLREGTQDGRLATALHVLGWAQATAGHRPDGITTLERALKLRMHLGLDAAAAQTSELLDVLSSPPS